MGKQWSKLLLALRSGYSLTVAGQGRDIDRCSTRHGVLEKEGRGQGRKGVTFFEWGDLQRMTWNDITLKKKKSAKKSMPNMSTILLKILYTYANVSLLSVLPSTYLSTIIQILQFSRSQSACLSIDLSIYDI